MNMIEKMINLIEHPSQKMVLTLILLISGISFIAIAVWQSNEIVIKVKNLKDVEITLKK